MPVADWQIYRTLGFLTWVAMDKEPDPLEFSAHKTRGRWQSLSAMLAVGLSVTVVILAILGHFATPRGTAQAPVPAVEDPFASEPPKPETGMSDADPQACTVMHQALEDINARMGEGVTEKQARYFRARRNKLYLMMRERCGV